MENIDLNISFSDNPVIPKYRQIIDAVLNLIECGSLKKGDQIPSLNNLSKQYSLSQDTVMMAYNEMKSRGIITSQVGKGYFIINTRAQNRHRILLLFDTFTAYKENLYDAIKSVLSPRDREQIFFHNNNLKIFQTILESSNGEYTEYVIMPIDHPQAFESICRLPANKVYILDQGKEKYKDLFPYVCQDFERDIYRVLKANKSLVKKYGRMILVIPQVKSHFRSIAVGFKDFCRQLPIKSEIVNDIRLFPVKKGDGFVVVDDRDLEFLLRWTIKNDLRPGVDTGIISYNETPLKGLVSSGITTISTDFAQMGKSLAQMILSGKKEKIDNPFRIILRQSF